MSRFLERRRDKALRRAAERRRAAILERRRVAPPGIARTLRARWVPGQRPGHRVSTAHLQAAYPFQAEGGLGARGVLIGPDASGGSFVYDPWELYGREITSPNIVIAGQVGSAKSSLVKSFLWRSRVFGRFAWVIDVKREYGPLAEAMGGTVVALRPGGDVCLNPLSPLAGPQKQRGLLRAVCTASLGRPLEPEEGEALAAALAEVSMHGDGEPTLRDVVAALLRPTERMADELATSADALAAKARAAALALKRLCDGDLRGMFDGPTSAELDFDAPIVVLDLHDVDASGPEALAILMTCGAAWMQARLDARRQEAELLGALPPKTLSVVDEAWRIFAQLGIGEWLQAQFKLARGYGQSNLVVMHRFSDMLAAGDAGSRQVRIAEGLLADAETRVIYRQAEDQIPLATELIGLTATEAALLPTLPRGQALWRVGQRSFLVQHVLSSVEEQLVNTDAAMLVGAAT
jgi:type IV secretory pathway VirB4 component